MTGHTPGNWFVDKDQSDFTISTDHGQEIARFLSAADFPCIEEGTEDHVDDEARANARLCAAAPDLLVALKDIVSEIRAYQSPECDDVDAPGAAELKAADAAISKAGG